MLRNAYAVLKDLPKDAYAGDSGADEALVKALFRRYSMRGLTSVADRSASDAALKIYRALRARGELTARMNATRLLRRAVS